MVGFLLEPYEGKGYHLYQDNYNNSVHQTNELLQKLIRVCETIRVNRGLPKDMIEEAKKLKKARSLFVGTRKYYSSHTKIRGSYI